MHASRSARAVGRIADLAPQCRGCAVPPAVADAPAISGCTSIIWPRSASIAARRAPRTERIGQIDAGGVAPLGSEQLRAAAAIRGCGAPPWRAALASGIGTPGSARHRPRRRDARTSCGRAVLEQPAHQIGQQRRARAHRRIDAHRAARSRASCSSCRYSAAPMPYRHWNS